MGQKLEGLVESVKMVGLTSDRPNRVRLYGHPFTYEVRAGLVDDATGRQFVLLDLAVRPDPGQSITAESLKRVSVKRLAAAVCVLGYVKPGDGPMYPYEVPDPERPETAREMSWEDLAMTSEPLAEPADKPRRSRPRRDKSISRQAKAIYDLAIERKRTPRQAREEVIAQLQPDGIPVHEKTVRRWLEDAND